MLCEIEFEYGRKFIPEEQELLSSLVLTEKPKFKEDGRLEYSGLGHILLAEDAARFGRFTVRRIVNNANTKCEAFGQRNTTIVNENCKVAVAGLGLLSVNQVEVRLDLCTDELQRDLNNGWSILAVCVQPDQRRPDYILGRWVDKT